MSADNCMCVCDHAWKGGLLWFLFIDRNAWGPTAVAEAHFYSLLHTSVLIFLFWGVCFFCVLLILFVVLCVSLYVTKT